MGSQPAPTEAAPSEGTEAATTEAKLHAEQQKQQRIKARWAMLRNAIVRASREDDSVDAHDRGDADDANTAAHSIHRFPGYALLQRQPISTSSSSCGNSHHEQWRSSLQTIQWDSSTPSSNRDAMLDEMECRIWALDALIPHSKTNSSFSLSLKCPTASDGTNDNAPFVSQQDCDHLQERLKHQFHVLLDPSSNGSSIRVARNSKIPRTKHMVCKYTLPAMPMASNGDTSNSAIQLFTREPQPHKIRLSLQQLVCHRQPQNNGVDNTGNICVWDSEQTLAYVLHHSSDDQVASLFATNDSNSSPLRILELGTGMAGLSGWALGLRYLHHVQTTTNSDYPPCVHLTLTDGHADGVYNNRVNHMLTQNAAASVYHQIHVNMAVLLWTDDWTLSEEKEQDVCCVSDCIHFQQFHAALICTVLRCLKVNGVAYFCQPTRADSLDNFMRMLDVATTLLRYAWWNPSVIQERHSHHSEASEAYDPNLHHPKILIVTKCREFRKEDRDRFVEVQQQRKMNK